MPLSTITLPIGFSPCPNDTFIFDALVHGKIDTGTLRFEPVMADVEELNRRAFSQQALPITKLSYHALGYLLPHYQLLRAGSALGYNCGPLLIARRPMSRTEIGKAQIAIPGNYTTAHFLLRLAYPEVRGQREMLFSDIEDAVLSGEVDAGLIIHENRFTYAERGLVQLCDLGEYWETQSNLPIPLGGIAVQRKLPPTIQQQVAQLLRQSIEYAFQNPADVMPFVRQHAQTMHDDVMRQHIALYVNDNTIDLGDTGERAVRHLFGEAQRAGLFALHEPIFV